MNTVTELTWPDGTRSSRVLVDAAELALLREQSRLAVLLVTKIYDRRRQRFYRAPMRQVEALTAALLQGRAE